MSLPIHSIGLLRDGYRSGRWTPADVVADVFARIEIAARLDPAIWISLRDRDSVLAEAQALDLTALAALPLLGIPFAIKDNIDALALPTTAGCPAFATVPARAATVVERLQQAGALLIGKTNLDQFATGLVGVRSPYGIPRSPFDPDAISGGSSSGSAVATARGLVGFALGTDTAGSGRVPAAFCNLIGLKPTRGLISATGVVPACQSLDCVSIFANTADDAAAVLAVAAGYDPADPYSRAPVTPVPTSLPGVPASFRFGVPRPEDLTFCGDAGAEALFAASVERLSALGGTAVTVDLSPFLAAARLLYEGPWVAERTAAVGDFLDSHPDAVNPVVAAIIASGRTITAPAAFTALHRLETLRRRCAPVWTDIDVLLVPTAPTTYSVAAVEADPIRLNTTLGTYTNFVNLLDLAALAVPAGFGSDGRPFGVSLIGPAFSDAALLGLGDALHRAAGVPVGALGLALPPPAPRRAAFGATEGLDLLVVGAHMSGLALNAELTAVGGRLVAPTRTAPFYRLFALTTLNPPRPGLIRVAADGKAIEAEIWRLPAAAFGGFVATVEPPHAIGRIDLADGRSLPGFVCDPRALAGQCDITDLGGWRGWLQSQA
ncbi:MAG: allophanate hydrolase [Azospirillaceae bacterium]|nr:allophanate hydrolase [Azospirillaceae bacterium]